MTFLFVCAIIWNIMYSFDLEKQLLAGLINHPDVFVEIAPFIHEDDFYNKTSQVNRTIFCIIKNAIESSEAIDYVMISERAIGLGISFEDNINIADYIQSLSLRKTSAKGIVSVAKDLKTLSSRRRIANCALKVKNAMEKASPNDSFESLSEKADQIFNNGMNIFDSVSENPENLFSEMEDWAEDRGNNPIEEFGLKCPHPRLHDLYGSLLREGNITVITARSGVGKTQWCLDFCLQTSKLNGGVPVLHFDNGEMSKEELMARLCSSMSDVPLHLIETGKWRQAGQDVVNRVRSVWPKIKKLNLYYYDVAGMSATEMSNLVKRFYYSKVGRGNPMIFNYDYIKTASEKSGNKNEWQIVGEMLETFKRMVKSEILFDGKPMIAMMTSVQSNRTGITNNRRTENIIEDESIVSLSDRITHICSHLFILRPKSNEEMLDSPDFGTHKLTCVKNRHLGKDYARAINPVRMPDESTFQRNCLFFTFENFRITENGDLQDWVETQLATDNIALNNNPNELPDI